MIGCGLVQVHYAFHNISQNSATTIKYFIKMLRYLCHNTLALAVKCCWHVCLYNSIMYVIGAVMLHVLCDVYVHFGRRQL